MKNIPVTSELVEDAEALKVWDIIRWNESGYKPREIRRYTVNVPDFDGFVWVLLDTGEVRLAYYRDGYFQTAESVGDAEGLHVEYYENVERWEEIKLPDFPKSING